MIDSVYRKIKDYYPPVFSEECKYVVKEKRRLSLSLTILLVSSNDSDKENSDEENSNEEN